MHNITLLRPPESAEVSWTAVDRAAQNSRNRGECRGNLRIFRSRKMQRTKRDKPRPIVMVRLKVSIKLKIELETSLSAWSKICNKIRDRKHDFAIFGIFHGRNLARHYPSQVIQLSFGLIGDDTDTLFCNLIFDRFVRALRRRLQHRCALRCVARRAIAKDRNAIYRSFQW